MKMRFLPFIALFAVLLLAAPVQQHTKEENLLRLSLKVMLYDKDLKHAYAIAQKGMERYPHETYWLRQRAQIALWLGKTDEAQHYFMKLYRTEHKENDRNEAERLAEATGDKRLLVTLHEEALRKRFDPEEAEQLYRLYNDTGYLERGYAFFSRLAALSPNRVAAQKALLLAFDFQPFSKCAKQYRRFEKHYGTDTTLLYRYARGLFSRRRYTEAFTTLEKRAEIFGPNEQKLYKLYINLAYITLHEEKLYTILTAMYRRQILPPEKETLFFRLLQKQNPEEALRFAYRRFMKTPTEAHFFQTAYLAADRGDFQKAQKLFDALPPQLRQKLSGDYRYRMLQAHTLQALHRTREAQKAWQAALTAAPLRADLHENYLWFLIDTADRPALHKELTFLAKHPALQKQMPYPAALGYFTLQQGDTAAKIVRKELAKDPRNWQLQQFYADILTLQKGENDAARHLRRAWLIARKAAPKAHFCNRDKSSCYDYIRLALRFDPRHARRYLAKGKKLLTPKALDDLKISLYSRNGATEKITRTLQPHAKKDPAAALTLALLRRDHESASQILQHHRTRIPLMDQISAYEMTGATAAYESRLFTAMQYNPQNSALADAFAGHIQNSEPKLKMQLSHSRRSDLQSRSATLAFHQKLPHAAALTLSAKREQLSRKSSRQNRNELSLALSRALKNGDIRLEAGAGSDNKAYTFFKTSLGYRKKRYTLRATAALHERDDTTAYTQFYGFRDRAALQFTYRRNRYEQITLDTEATRYRPDPHSPKSYGNAAQISYTRYLRLAYPDLCTQLFAGTDTYRDKSGKLPRNFRQAGINLAIGTSAKSAFHRTARPYATATLLYNTQTHIGYSMTAGVGKRLLGHDYLGIEMEYANGTGKYREDYFSVKVGWRYW